VAADINAAGLKAISIPGNILDADFAENLIEGTVKAFGKINHIVNNAGFTFDAMLHKTTDKQWEMMLAVHNTAPFKIIRAAAKYLRQKDGANKSIVNVSLGKWVYAYVWEKCVLIRWLSFLRSLPLLVYMVTLAKLTMLLVSRNKSTLA
jgi:NAD(P)-dependent dehydrogenase (short-subunit alcohol dehydrogenase family)